MLDEDKKREIQKAAAGMEFIPAEITMTEKKSHYKKIPLTEISGLGAEFAEMMPAFRTITSTTTANVSGLYRCTIPKGVSGTLAKAKDGSGYLGTIMNNGIKGQARWNPVDKVSATKSIVAPIDPVSIFMVAVTVEMSQKLDKIEKLGNEIFDYLKAQDRAKLESNYEALINVYSNFKNNLNDEKWQILKYNDVQTIKRETSAQVKVLRSQIEKTIDRHDLVHNELQASDLVNKVQNQFYYYRLGVFMYAFASFIEALLQGNFEEGNLKAIQKDISKYNQNYEKFYKDCYKKLERYSNTTVASQTLKAISNASGQMLSLIHI